MLAFLLLLLPVSIVVYCVWNKDIKDFVAICAGAFSAVIFCALKVFFTFSHRLIPYSFSENFIYFLVKQNCIPLVVVYLVFVLIVKDSMEYKVKSFFPLISSFYTVYLPYLVISTSSSVYSGYAIFIKPVIYLAMIMQCAFSIYYFYYSLKIKKYLFMIINFLLVILYMIYPAMVDAKYVINSDFTPVLIISILYALLPFGYAGYKFVKNILSR